MDRFCAIYWTLPVTRAGFTDLDPDPDVAAGQSRTIRYQRDRVRRHVREVQGALEREVVVIGVSPDRAGGTGVDELRPLRRSHPGRRILWVDFAQVAGWRRHWLLEEALGTDGEALTPDPILSAGFSFDPAEHFRDWRLRDRAHAGDRAGHRAQVLLRLDDLPEMSLPARARLLNAEGLATHGGRPWTAENLRKFLKAGPADPA